MIGIYKIINKVNNKCYIGQSKNIEKRFLAHKEAVYNDSDKKRYNYPLYRAIRKYGLENFSFKIVEECSSNQLNEREKYWIKYYNSCLSGYNQTEGGDYASVPQKLSIKKVKEIKLLLKYGNISNKEIANIYGVHKDTIRDINVGRTWHDENENYPIKINKFDPSFKKVKINYCIDCGKEISLKAKRCTNCANKIVNKNKSKSKIKLNISREELKQLIRTTPFTQIGKMYNVSDNAVRKWCDKYSLPRTVKEIKTYSDKEWEQL